MKYTSLGFHTFKIFTRLTYQEAKRIYHAFDKLVKLEEVDIIPYGEVPTLRFDNGKAVVGSKPLGFNVNYRTLKTGVRKGISWTLRFSNQSPDFKEYTLEAQINPKILAGIIDYITAATEDDMNAIPDLFNHEAKRISDAIPMFSRYKLKRIDYCINFHLGELGIPCTADQMIKLIKRGNIPHNYKEELFYDKTSRRYKSDDLSFYLKSNSTVIQCYDKHDQLKEKHPDNPSIDFAKNIIRFEVQCNYMKVYSMRRNLKKAPKGYPYNEFKEFFSPKVCETIIRRYFDRVVMRGDYYPIKHSRNLINERGFRGNLGQRMIATLNAVNPSRGGGGVHKVKAFLKEFGIDPYDFKRGLLELQIHMGINPVAIPGDWGIMHIPNLMDAYDKLKGIPLRDKSDIMCSPFDSEF